MDCGRAAHGLGQWSSGRGIAERLLSNQLLGSLPPKGKTLHDIEMLSRPNSSGYFSLSRPTMASANEPAA
jgi:hypothetical protein